MSPPPPPSRLSHAQIVAGLEPENTNVFLQMLAAAARQGTAADVVQVWGGVCGGVLRRKGEGCGFLFGLREAGGGEWTLSHPLPLPPPPLALPLIQRELGGDDLDGPPPSGSPSLLLPFSGSAYWAAKSRVQEGLRRPLPSPPPQSPPRLQHHRPLRPRMMTCRLHLPTSPRGAQKHVASLPDPRFRSTSRPADKPKMCATCC